MKNLVLLLLIFFVSCARENLPLNENKSAIIKVDNSYSDFKQNLKPDMTYEAIVAKFGAPSKDIGSGIHIYVYPLNDSTEIWIGFTGQIIYARQVDQYRQIVNIII